MSTLCGWSTMFIGCTQQTKHPWNNRYFYAKTASSNKCMSAELLLKTDTNFFQKRSSLMANIFYELNQPTPLYFSLFKHTEIQCLYMSTFCRWHGVLQCSRKANTKHEKQTENINMDRHIFMNIISDATASVPDVFRVSNKVSARH